MDPYGSCSTNDFGTHWLILITDLSGKLQDVVTSKSTPMRLQQWNKSQVKQRKTVFISQVTNATNSITGSGKEGARRSGHATDWCQMAGCQMGRKPVFRRRYH
jgi:hypothetical protein